MRAGYPVRRFVRQLAVALLLVTAQNLRAQEEWLPVTPADWLVGGDGRDSAAGATMIFERVIRDDGRIDRGVVRETVYRRIRITAQAGRSQGDVRLMTEDAYESIKSVNGRTILPDGTIIELNEDDVHTSDALAVRDFKRVQTAFALPGITGNCILEYRFVRQIKRKYTLLPVQKDIPLLHFECVWRYVTTEYELRRHWAMVGSRALAPNYVWLNSSKPIAVSWAPADGNVREARFEVDSIPAYRDEPMATSEWVSGVQLRLYYAADEADQEFWFSMGLGLNAMVSGFLDDDDAVKEIASEWDTLGTDEEKIFAAYRWLQANIRNTSSGMQREGDEENETVADLLEHRYGSTNDINLLFHALLESMDIPSRVCATRSRLDGPFVEGARYMQFDRFVVLVSDPEHADRFFSPGDVLVAPGNLPPDLEGSAVVQSAELRSLTTRMGAIPLTDGGRNSRVREFRLEWKNDRYVGGTIRDTRNGHAARETRLDLRTGSSNDCSSRMIGSARKELPGWELDSAQVENAAEPSMPMSVTYRALQRNAVKKLANGYLLRLMDLPGPVNNPFNAEERQKPVVFSFPFRDTDAVVIRLPDSLAAESLPEGMLFVNEVGMVTGAFSRTESTIVGIRCFEIVKPIIMPEQYAALRELYSQAGMLQESAIVMLNRRVRPGK